MKRLQLHTQRTLFITSIILMVSGCSFLAPQPDISRFYVLSATASPQVTGIQRSATENLKIGVGPVTFPDYLERNQIVTRVSSNQLLISNTDYWAAPLRQSFTRVMEENLARELGTNQIISYPWYRTNRPDYAIAIDVYRFETEEPGTVRLFAQWSILNPATSRVFYNGKSDIREPTKAANIEEDVNALSRAAAALSTQIASEIAKLHAESGPGEIPE